MGNVAGYNIYSPWNKEASAEFVDSHGHVERRAIDLVAEIHERNKKAGKADPFRVCAIHRNKPLHRWFNVSMSVPNRGIRCEREYGGALSHAESLLDGPWRIATDEEEKACEAKDAADRVEALKARSHEAATGMRELGRELVASLAASGTAQAKGK